MTPHTINLVNASLVALPMALACTRRLLLTEKSSASASDRPGEKMETITARANQMTSVLRKFEACDNYRHFGINE